MHRLLRAGLVCWVLLPAARAEEMKEQDIESSEGRWVFSLLPKSLQKNPVVDQTVITEMTEEGKKLALPSRENPAYYVAEAGGFHAEGQGPVDAKLPPAAELENCLQRALATNHYLPASPGHPPSLMILYHWGVHTNLDRGSAEIAGSAMPDTGHRNLLGRAALVGGNKFAAELKTALEKQDLQDETTFAPAGSMLSSMGPLRLFTDRDRRTRQLYEESLADCHFVVASAYDYHAAAQGQRKLLWRSKMTADSLGVAMVDTLPGLILNAGKYLGRDMPVAATLSKPVNRETSTKLGPLEVKEYLETSTPAKSPEPAPKDQPKP
jgi:hypothetical protein